MNQKCPKMSLKLKATTAQLCGKNTSGTALVVGKHQERSLVRADLNLPQDLIKHITSRLLLFGQWKNYV